MSIIFISFVVAFVGMFCHWLKSWLRETISATFLEYLVSAPKHTGATLFALITALITAYQTGLITGIDEQSITIAFMAGFTADSAINKEG